jgi:glycosyltransferase involved in cell wall biosynthesis
MTARGTDALARIALITRRYWPQVGGAEMAMANLANEFCARGHQTIVLTAQWEPHWPTECVHREVPVVRLSQPQVRGWGTIRYVHALMRWLRRHRGQWDAVLVSMMKHDAYTAVQALRGSSIPVLIRAEGAGETGDVAWQRTARFGSRIKRVCLQADAFIAPSPFIAGELQVAGYASEKLNYIANGVAIGPPRDLNQQLGARLAVSDANASLEMVPDAPLVVFTGRLHANKGLEDLVRAWQEIARRRPNARLWLIGEGPHRDELFDLIVDLGLHHQVFLPGAFDDVAEVLTAADLFVLPSYEEGMSLALLEAMSAGVPVIATNIPGNRLLVTDNEHGLLVPPHDPPALLAAIERLLTDKMLAARLALQARARVEQEFSLAMMADRHLALIEQTIVARQRATPS